MDQSQINQITSMEEISQEYFVKKALVRFLNGEYDIRVRTDNNKLKISVNEQKYKLTRSARMSLRLVRIIDEINQDAAGGGGGGIGDPVLI